MRESEAVFRAEAETDDGEEEASVALDAEEEESLCGVAGFGEGRAGTFVDNEATSVAVGVTAGRGSVSPMSPTTGGDNGS